MAKTATGKASDSFLGLEMEKFLPNKLLRNVAFFVVVIWGVAFALAALMFDVYLLTPEEWAFLSPTRLKTILNFMAFSGNVFLFAAIFMLGYMVRARRE